MQARNQGLEFWKLGKMFYPREIILLTWKNILSDLLSFGNSEVGEVGDRTALIRLLLIFSLVT